MQGYNNINVCKNRFSMSNSPCSYIYRGSPGVLVEFHWGDLHFRYTYLEEILTVGSDIIPFKNHLVHSSLLLEGVVRRLLLYRVSSLHFLSRSISQLWYDLLGVL